MSVEFTPEELHLALLRALPDGLCFFDTGGRILFWNDAAERIAGFSPAEAASARAAEDIFSLTQPAGFAEDHFFLRHHDGHHLPVLLRTVNVESAGGQPLGELHVFSATGRERRVDIGTHPAGLLLIRIDGYEQLSHRLGPEASEMLLSMADQTTMNCLRDGDSCRRLRDGTVLAAVASEQGLADLAERIRLLIQSSRIQWWGEHVGVTATIATAVLLPNESVGDAVARAEERVRAAMQRGSNQVVA